MSVKPILFNAEMVRTILDGRKTVTRQVVKFLENRNPQWSGYIPDGAVLYGSNNIPAAKSPYRPGDVLWVRETFRVDYLTNIVGSGRVHYKADGSFGDLHFQPARYEMMRRAQLKPGWRPNENMPKEAARIWLRVTDVRVERLQEITIAGLQEEGILPDGYISQYTAMTEGGELFDPWKLLWDSTIKSADLDYYGWDANPLVWVIAFERCEKPEEG